MARFCLWRSLGDPPASTRPEVACASASAQAPSGHHNALHTPSGHSRSLTLKKTPPPAPPATPPAEDDQPPPPRPTAKSTSSVMGKRGFPSVMTYAAGVPNVLLWKSKSKPTTPQPENNQELHDKKSLNGKTQGKHCDDDHVETASESSKSSSSASSAYAAAKPFHAVCSLVNTSSRYFLGRMPSGRVAHSKSHARSVSDVSESDFAPFASGTLVSTKYGLGTVLETREDGVMVVQVQTIAPMVLYTVGDEDFHAVPALVRDEVHTSSGEGYVVGYNTKNQTYVVRITDSDVEHEVVVPQADVQRQEISRRRSDSASAQASYAITKGLTSAFRTIVSTSSGISASTYQFVSSRYHYGQCVITTYGPGYIIALDQANKMVQVQLTWGAMAFLHEDMVKYYLKALVGMEVATKFGAGRVTDVRPEDAIYTVRLDDVKPNENPIVFVHESDLNRPRALSINNVQKQVRGTLKALSAVNVKIPTFYSHKTPAPTDKPQAKKADEEVSTAGI